MVLQVPKIEVSQKFLGTLMSDISQGSIPHTQVSARIRMEET